MSYKSITQKSYQATADEYARKVSELAPMESIQRFVEMLPPKAKIIDMGCGSGRDAKIFTEKGISVLGIDFCQNLIDIAKAHAPLAEFQVMDMESAIFVPESFDGVWASCSLLHISKTVLPSVLKNTYSMLKQGGTFYLNLKKGDGEILEKDSRYENVDIIKFWSYYEEKELLELIKAAKFKIVECVIEPIKSHYQSHEFLRVFCQK